MLQPARGRANTKHSALDDELIRPEQVLGHIPTFHLTADDVKMEMDSFCATAGSIVSHSFLRGFSGTVSVQLYHLLGRTGKYILGNGARFGTVQQCGGALLGE